MWSSLSSLGKLAVVGFVGIEATQLASNLQNNGGTPKDVILKDFFTNQRMWMLVGAVAVFVYFFGRRK